MKRLLLLLIWGMGLLLAGSLFSQTSDRPPNVLIILADDLGFSDLGCYGSEIQTPNLDALAAGGLRFTQFYNTGRCWPTRGALMTGYYAQQIRRDKLPGVTPSGGGGKRPEWAQLLPARLKSQGYRAYHSGKWHIDGMPLANGFDRSYYLRDQGRFFNPKTHYEDDVQLPAVEPGTEYYGTTAVADHAITYLKAHQQSHADEPFFQYLAFAAPHFPLHAEPEDIARYEGTYQKDWERMRKKRWKRLKKMGIIGTALSAVEREVGPPYDFPEAMETLGPGEVNRPLPWKDLSPEQQDFQASKMAIHAAMIDRMDQEIGKVFAQIKAMGAWENTLIVFLSDNGASAEIMVRDDGHDPNAVPGSAATYLCLGPGWSTTSNTPFRRHKTWVHEGGISTPLIAHWPAGIQDQGALRHNPGHVIDLTATIIDIAGAGSSAGDPPVPGKSLLPVFAQDHSVVHNYLWWYHEGNRALRVGDWKIVAAGSEGEWELYNLAADRAESQNLAATKSDKLAELVAIWTARRDEFKALALQDLEKE